jgi:hypothetical protein
MRVSIITLHNHKNYGSVLQAFATQEKLKEFASSVEVIDYRRTDTTFWGCLKSALPVKVFVRLASIIRNEYVFGRFLRQFLNRTTVKYTTDEDFDKYPAHDGIYCTGSDQVWNTGWNNGVIAPLYLSFLPADTPRFAYSSSFGNDQERDDFVRETKPFIDKYNWISVREDSGIRILREQYGYENVIQLVDPTLAMPPEFWRKYAPKSKLKDKYILIYQLNASAEFDRYAKELSKRTGLRLVRLCRRYHHIFRNGRKILLPHVMEFITLIDNAEYVLTDSFHATALSMNLNTQPFCIYPKNYSGRIASFLHLVGAEHRHITDFNDYDIINRPVDFDYVNLVLENERIRVNDFLCRVFQIEPNSNLQNAKPRRDV